MANFELTETLPSALVACTITRDIQEFESLIDEMEDEFGESWGDISFDDAMLFLGQDDSNGVKFMIVAVNSGDEANCDGIAAIVQAGRAKGIKVILVSDHISPGCLHKLMRSGADDFLPYPLPESTLTESLEKLRNPPPAPVIAPPEPAPIPKSGSNRDGAVLPVHGLAGGVGGTTFAVNLAVELAALAAKSGQRVCLLDFDFQFGNVATYLDLPRRDQVMDLLADAALADYDTLLGAMQPYKDGLFVLTSPADMVPLEIVTAQDVGHLIDMAKANFDYVIIDMPTAIVSWTEQVLTRADVYFGIIGLDLRNAQNVLRLIRALKADGLPHEKLRFGLSRAPRFTDLNAKSRLKRMADSLDISIELQLADGLDAVAQANDQGLPLMDAAPKNALRKDIQKLAKSLYDLNTAPVDTKR